MLINRHTYLYLCLYIILFIWDYSFQNLAFNLSLIKNIKFEFFELYLILCKELPLLLFTRYSIMTSCLNRKFKYIFLIEWRRRHSFETSLNKIIYTCMYFKIHFWFFYCIDKWCDSLNTISRNNYCHNGFRRNSLFINAKIRKLVAFWKNIITTIFFIFLLIKGEFSLNV